MSRFLLINENCGIGSHGKICADIAHEYEKKGYEVKYAYGREKRVSDDCKKYAVKIGSSFDLYMHGALTRIFDKHGFGSKSATKRFLDWAEDYNPNEIWLHNLHGYYINVEMLFAWIKRRPDMIVKWTLHDCWAFTGHCCHFTIVKCKKWKEHCRNCPQKTKYPSSYFMDNSFENFERKRVAFSGVRNMMLITPSKWLANLVGESFLKDYPTEIRYNRVNSAIFKPTDSEFRKLYGIEDKILILGVANIWTEGKGLKDFIELDSLLNDHFVIVLIGLSKKQIKDIPDDMIGIERTFDQKELAGIYTTADIFVNPSLEETFGMTSLEAHLCGTSTICYEGTACAEIAEQFGGRVVYKGAKNLYFAIEEIVESGRKNNKTKRTDI